jgi:hypothetical protein
MFLERAGRADEGHRRASRTRPRSRGAAGTRQRRSGLRERPFLRSMLDPPEWQATRTAHRQFGFMQIQELSHKRKFTSEIPRRWKPVKTTAVGMILLIALTVSTALASETLDNGQQHFAVQATSRWDGGRSEGTASAECRRPAPGRGADPVEASSCRPLCMGIGSHHGRAR